jgi:hypothetical protein
VVRLDPLPQKRPALQERAASQVLAVEVEEVEGKEHEPMRRRVDGERGGHRRRRSHPGQDFAIDQGGAPIALFLPIW